MISHFDCVDLGFKEKEPVDVVIRPEDIDIVDVKDGKMTGEVLSVLFKGVHYEIMVETVPGTSVTVNMSVIKNQDVTGDGGKEKISASDFYVDIEDIGGLTTRRSSPVQMRRRGIRRVTSIFRLRSSSTT